MPYRLRSVAVVVSVDKLDASGNVENELRTEPIRLFPHQLGEIQKQCDDLLVRLEREEKKTPVLVGSRSKKRQKV